jgi:hypothetical protein
MLEISVDRRLMRLAAPNVEVMALLDCGVPPVSEIMRLVHERSAEDDFRVGRRELSRLFGAGELLNTRARLSYQSNSGQLAIRGTRNDQDETLAAVDVVDPPGHDGAVAVDCQPLQRMLRAIPGDPVGISISGDVLGGPGVRLWPWQELPGGAVLLYGLRGQVA